MCGIVGCVSPQDSPDQVVSMLSMMNDQIIHRGPDDDGNHAISGAGIGMRRLSIIDVAGGQQPLGNGTGDIQVVCNGEIYNHRELREKLRGLGYFFKTGSDVEVIVYLYEEYGDDFAKHLRGMYGLAVLDSKRRRVVIARDRLGKKPLFYASLDGKFLFGSEMKSLLAVDSRLRTPDYSIVASFFQFGFIAEPRTIYQHIQRLPAGHLGIYEYEKGTFETKPYWDLEFEADDSLSEPEWLERLDAMLLDCVKARLESEVPLGVFLSGGIDSSAIVAYAHKAGLSPLKTFTIGFDRKQWDESDDAARIAKHFGTQHHNLRISESDLLGSFTDTLTSLIRHFDEPFGDDSALPMYHVSRLAREHVTVILSGDGGDELFAGYSSYQGFRFAQVYRKLAPGLLGRKLLPSIPAVMAKALGGSLRYKALRAANVLKDSALPFYDCYRDKVAIWQTHELAQLLTPDAVNNSDFFGAKFLPDKIWSILNSKGDMTSRLTNADLQWYLLDDVLVKVDRMSMAHSLEVRSPLLDHNMVELAAQMPTRMKIRGSTGKYALRKILEDKLPKASLQKRKQGFGVPLRDWMRGELTGVMREYLDKSSGCLPTELFQHQKVDSMIAEHQKGAADHSRKLWLLLVFAAWHREYQS